MKVETNHGALRALLFVNAFSRLSAGLMGPIASLFVVQVGGDLRHAGELAAVYGFFATLVGMYVSKRPPSEQRMFLLLSLGLLVPVNFGYLLVEGHTELYLLQALLGITSGINKPSVKYWMSRYTSKDDAAPTFQLDTTTKGVMKTVGALAGGYMSHHLGFEAVFVVMGSVSAMNLIVALFWLDRRYFRPEVASQGSDG